MKVRAKFYVSKVSEIGNSYGGRYEISKPAPKEEAHHNQQYVSTGVPIREITMQAVYDDGIVKENSSFAEATPNGTITFMLNNPACKDEFQPGDSYYIDFYKA